MGLITLRILPRSSLLSKASFRAKGRRVRRRSEALGTPVIAKRPGPEGPRVSITVLDMDSSLSRSEEEGCGGGEDDRRRRSEKWR